MRSRSFQDLGLGPATSCSSVNGPGIRTHRECLRQAVRAHAAETANGSLEDSLAVLELSAAVKELQVREPDVVLLRAPLRLPQAQRTSTSGASSTLGNWIPLRPGPAGLSSVSMSGPGGPTNRSSGGPRRADRLPPAHAGSRRRFLREVPPPAAPMSGTPSNLRAASLGRGPRQGSSPGPPAASVKAPLHAPHPGLVAAVAAAAAQAAVMPTRRPGRNGTAATLVPAASGSRRLHGTDVDGGQQRPRKDGKESEDGDEGAAGCQEEPLRTAWGRVRRPSGPTGRGTVGGSDSGSTGISIGGGNRQVPPGEDGVRPAAPSGGEGQAPAQTGAARLGENRRIGDGDHNAEGVGRQGSQAAEAAQGAVSARSRGLGSPSVSSQPLPGSGWDLWVHDLYNMIKRCGSWRELQVLHQSCSSQLIPAHIPALMLATAKLIQASVTNAKREAGRRSAQRRRAGAAAGAEDAGSEPGGTLSREEAAAASAFMWELAGSTLRLARSRELPARSLANAIWAVAKLPLSDLPPLATTGLAPRIAATEGVAGSGSGAGLGSGSAGQQALRCGDWQGWAVEMLKCCMPKLWKFTPQDISLMLWAVATLECGPLPPAFLETVLATSLPLLPEFGPQALSNTLWALSKLRYQPPAAWLHAACAAATPELSAFGPQALATTLAALAHLEHQPPPAGCAAILDCCRGLWESAVAAAGWPSAAGTAAAAARVPPPSSLPPPTPQSVALTAWAVARLGLRPPADWVDALAAAAAATSDRMARLDVAQVMWALATLRWDVGCGQQQPAAAAAPAPAPTTTAAAGAAVADDSSAVVGPAAAAGAATTRDPQAHLDALLRAWRRCLDTTTGPSGGGGSGGDGDGCMQPQQLSACLVACVHLGLVIGPDQGQLPPALVQRTLDVLGGQLRTAPGQSVANALWALARLNWRPTSEWVAAAVNRFMSCLEDQDAGPQEVANLWWALGRLRWAPSPEEAQDLLTRTLLYANAEGFRSGEITMLLRGICGLGIRLPKPLLDRLVSFVRRAGRQEFQAAALAAGIEPSSAEQRAHGLSRRLAGRATSAAGDGEATAGSGRELPGRWGRDRADSVRGSAAAPPPPPWAPDVPPDTLATLMLALGAMNAASQRSSLSALLERALRPLAAKATAAIRAEQLNKRTLRLQGRRPSPRRQQLQPQPPPPAVAMAARQVALMLKSAVNVGMSFKVWPPPQRVHRGSDASDGAGSGARTTTRRLAKPGGIRAHNRGVTGAAITAVWSVLPAASAGDLSMMMWALVELETSVPLALLAAVVKRTSQLCAAAGRIPVPASGVGNVPSNSKGDGDRGGGGGGRGGDDSRSPGLGAPTPAVLARWPGPAAAAAGTRAGVAKIGSGDQLPRLLCAVGLLLQSSVQRQRAEAALTRGGRPGTDPAVPGPRTGMPQADDPREVAEAALAARWEALLAQPDQAAARAAVLAAALGRVQTPALRRSLDAERVRQLIQGLAWSWLHPNRDLCNALVLACVRLAPAMTAPQLASCLRQLASMRAEMDPRVARVLVGRMRAALRRGVWIEDAPTGMVGAACGSVSVMVALWVVQRQQRVRGPPHRSSGGGGGDPDCDHSGERSSRRRSSNSAIGGRRQPRQVVMAVPASEQRWDTRSLAGRDEVRFVAKTTDPRVMANTREWFRGFWEERAEVLMNYRDNVVGVIAAAEVQTLAYPSHRVLRRDS